MVMVVVVRSGDLRGSLPFERFLDVNVDLIFIDIGVPSVPKLQSASRGQFRSGRRLYACI